MKLDDAKINLTALAVIDEYIAEPCEYIDQINDCDHIRILALGYARGVMDLAKRLKELVEE